MWANFYTFYHARSWQLTNFKSCRSSLILVIATVNFRSDRPGMGVAIETEGWKVLGVGGE
ncbi:MAG TPA: hypothetical protein V6D21_17630 [Candidatus Obscuribacterales bacterium]